MPHFSPYFVEMAKIMASLGGNTAILTLPMCDKREKHNLINA